LAPKLGVVGTKVAVVGAKGTPLPDVYLSNESSLATDFTLSLFNLLAAMSKASSNFGGGVRQVFCPNCGVLANHFVARTSKNFSHVFHKCPFLVCFSSLDLVI
jgi:hypothetical protein